jgi:hypothetical protein
LSVIFCANACRSALILDGQRAEDARSALEGLEDPPLICSTVMPREALAAERSACRRRRS